MPKPKVQHVTAEEIAAKYGLTLDFVEHQLSRARIAMRPWTKDIGVLEEGKEVVISVTRLGAGVLITPYGRFWQYDFHLSDYWVKYSVLVHCNSVSSKLQPIFRNKKSLTMRTDSGCETGQVFHDRTCECREQLHLAMQEIVRAGEGLIVNIPRQDGRGKGLPFKLATLLLQDTLGVNTVESASMLAEDGDIDIRTYAGVIACIKFLGVTNKTTINLATNNPYKSNVFLDNGFELAPFKPIVVPATAFTARHLQAKHDHLGHAMIGLDLNDDGIVDVRVPAEQLKK